MVYGVLAVVLIGGVALVASGVRGRRVDDRPVCRGCGFDLSGIAWDGSRCPECGRSLTARAVRIGHRRRRGWRIAIGSLVVLIVVGAGGTMAWSSATRFDWNTVKPAWLLVRESRGVGATGLVALDEILRRIERGEIDEGAVARAVEVVLERQADDGGAWDRAWGDFVEEAHGLGAVSEGHWARYASQAISIETAYRERVHAELGLPFRMVMQMRCGSRGPRTNALVQVGPLEGVAANETVSVNRTGLGGDGWTHTWTHVLELDGAEAGTLEVRLPVRVEIFDLASRGGASLGVFERVHELEIEVVDRSEAVVTLMAPTQLAIEPTDATRDLVSGLTDVSLSRGSGAGDYVVVRLTKPGGIAMAARVILQRGDVEIDLGSLCATVASDGARGVFSVTDKKHALAEFGLYDVILRPDPDAAHGVVGVDEIWGEEIVIWDVMLR